MLFFGACFLLYFICLLVMNFSTVKYTYVTFALVNVRYLSSLVVIAVHQHSYGVGLIPAGRPIVENEYYVSTASSIISTRV